MADPYWDTIDDGSQVIGSYDITKGQRSPIDAFQLEVDRKAKELQDLLDLRDMAKAEAEKAMSYTGRNPIEQAIVGLAPMALGAILGGKQGLGAGGIGAVAGLKAYDSYADEEAKRQQLIASQFYKDAQANVTASQKAMDALRGKQTEMSVDHQNDLEIAMLNNQAKMQLKGMGGDSSKNQPIRPEVLAGLEPIYGKLPEGITPEELKIQDAAMRQKSNQESADARKEQSAQSKVRAEGKIADSKKELEQLRVEGMDWFKMPTPKKVEKAETLREAHTEAETAYDQLIPIVRKYKGFIIGGGKTEAQKADYAKQQSAISKLTLAYKNLYSLGANFSESEQTMVSKLVGTPAARDQDMSIVSSWFTNEVFQRSPVGGLENARNMAKQGYLAGLANIGAVPLNLNLNEYSEKGKKILLDSGVKIDEKTGKGTYRKPIEEYLQIWDSLSSRKSNAPVSEVTTNAKATPTPAPTQGISDEVKNQAFGIVEKFLQDNPNPTKEDGLNILRPQLDALKIPTAEQRQIVSIAQDIYNGSKSK